MTGTAAASSAASMGRPAGSGTAAEPAPAAGDLVVVRQHDGQVVDVHRTVAGELAVGPRLPGLVVVGQHDGQVVDVNRAVAIGVARQRRLDEKGVVHAVERSGADDIARIIHAIGVLQVPAGARGDQVVQKLHRARGPSGNGFGERGAVLVAHHQAIVVDAEGLAAGFAGRKRQHHRRVERAVVVDRVVPGPRV